ncbi:6150_t:CDS:2, partial [Acaulospora morrowiae]
WKRLNASIWTRLFILTSIIQAIIGIFLEVRVLIRNNEIRLKIASPTSSDCDVSSSMRRMDRIEGENGVFIIFQGFQMWLCMNTIFKKDTIQLIVITVLNFICSAYSIVQISEIRIWRNNLCQGINISDPEILRYDLPLVIFLMTFATIMGFLCYKLYGDFGWIIYRRIRGNPVIRRIYRTYLIFVILLKLDVFFLLVLAVESWIIFSADQFSIKSEFSYVPESYSIFHYVVTSLIGFLLVLAFCSTKKEWKIGMYAFSALWIAVIIDFALILRYSFTEDTWYFFIAFLLVAILLATTTWVWGIFVLQNFDRGLKDVFNRAPDNPGAGQDPIDDDDEEGGGSNVILN